MMDRGRDGELVERRLLGVDGIFIPSLMFDVLLY
jgi:hypothetical protein